MTQVSLIDILECPHIGYFIHLRDDLPLEAIDEFFHRLAAAVVLSAIMDAAGGSVARTKRKEEAISWLCDPENEDTWFFLAGVQRWRVLRWIQAGCKKGRLIKKGTGHEHKSKFLQYELKTKPKEDARPLQDDPDLGPEY